MLISVMIADSPVHRNERSGAVIHIFHCHNKTRVAVLKVFFHFTMHFNHSFVFQKVSTSWITGLLFFFQTSLFDLTTYVKSAK